MEPFQSNCLPRDLLRKRQPHEPAVAVDVYHAFERALWARRLSVSEEALMEAVREVGVGLDAVRLFLGR